MKARYNAKTNTFRELPDMEKPQEPHLRDYAWSDQYHDACAAYSRDLAIYNDHLAFLREIPGHYSCKGVFIHDCDYEESKHYKLQDDPCPYFEDIDDPVEYTTYAYPVGSAQSEDEALIHYEYAGKLAYCLGITINGRDWEEKALPELKKHYTITPR